MTGKLQKKRWKNKIEKMKRINKSGNYMRKDEGAEIGKQR